MGEVEVENLLTDSLSTLDIPEEVEAFVYIEEPLPKIETDPMLLRRIIVNLVNNAVQAMPNGGKLKISAGQDRQTDKLVLTIEDTGIGIPKELQEKIFTPLFTTKSKGQGFGLAVVKRLTETLGGAISFESHVELMFV